MLQNCLFKNNEHGYTDYSGYGVVEFCTFINNSNGMFIIQLNNGELTIRNNLFHCEQDFPIWGIRKSGGADVDEYHNAFYNVEYAYADYSGNPIAPLDASDFSDPQISGTHDLAGDPLYNSYYKQTFFSQRYCLSSTTPLVNGGYDPDTAGMPAFSTQTNNIPDTGQVDIGYHAPLPIDTDGDGFYDYVELWQGTNPYGATTWYVKATAAAGGKGLSWNSAFDHLQDALTNPLLVPGDQIWVAAGTYYPDEGQEQDDNERSSTFELIEGVSLYGGFAGTETLLGQRNWTVNETILSGDIDKDDFGDAENCYHVVTGADNAVLDGFTIIGGYADGESNDEHGGGMLNFGTSPIIRHCMFKYNAALYGGGAIANIASPVIPQPFFQNCLVVNNQAANFGGGVYSHFSMPMVVNCTFSGNQAQYGGAIFEDCSSGWVVDSILWGDDATSGSEVAIYTPDDIDCYSTFYYNDVQGDIAGVIGAGGYASVDWQENLNMDPLYANAASGDFHLKSAIGRWTPGGWVIDSVTSPCINAGYPGSDCSQQPIPNAGRIEMGAYGNTGQASKYSRFLDIWVDKNHLGTSDGTREYPYKTVVNGISAVLANGTVHVENCGHYDERLSFNSNWTKPFTLKGEDGQPTLYGSEAGSVVVFMNVPVVITFDNIQISGGKSEAGGGVYIDQSSPEFFNCSIAGNQAYSANQYVGVFGGGIYIQGGEPLFVGCRINANDANHALSSREGEGGGLYIYNSWAEFYYCEFGPEYPWNNAEEDISDEMRLYTATAIPSFYYCTTRGNTGLMASKCTSYPNEPYVEN